MQKTFRLVEREFISRVYDKKFLLATLLTPLLLGVMMILPGYLASRDTGTQYKIAVIDASGMNMLSGLEADLKWDRMDDEEDADAEQQAMQDMLQNESGGGDAAAGPIDIPEGDEEPTGEPKYILTEFEADPEVAPPPPLAEQLGMTDRFILQMMTGRRDSGPLRVKDEFVWNPASEELQKQVEKGEYHALLVFPPNFETDNYFHFFAKSTGDMQLISRVRTAVSRVQQKSRIEDAGIDAATLERLTAFTRIDTRNIKEEERQKGRTNPLQAFMALMLVYFTIILYGTTIMNSVLEDKQTRIAEVMLAKVNAREFLLGKIIGVGLAGMLQYGIWVGLYFAATKIWPDMTSSAFAIPLRSLPIIVASFLVGYIIYATLYAVVGAIAENSQDAAQLQWPVLMFLILPLITVWGVLRDPETPFALFMTWFPMTMPLTLPARMVIGPVPDWQLYAGYAFAFLFSFVVVWLAGRIFQAVILMYGKKPSLKEFFRMMVASDNEPMTTAAGADGDNPPTS